jgi:hypothetical protein
LTTTAAGIENAECKVFSVAACSFEVFNLPRGFFLEVAKKTKLQVFKHGHHLGLSAIAMDVSCSTASGWIELQRRGAK